MGIFSKSQERTARDSENRGMQFEREQQTLKHEPEYEEIYHREMQRQDLLKWQQELNDELETLKHDLKREKYNEKENKWEPQTTIIGFDKNNQPVTATIQPLMNDIGINMIETLCRPLMSRNLINSTLSEEIILNLLKTTADTLVNDIAINHFLYDLSFNDWSRIRKNVLNVITPTPYRALNGFNKKTDSTMSKRIEAFSGNGSEEKPKKMFGLFGG